MELAEVTVQDVEGREHRLGELWRDRAAVLVFVRHFGWAHCAEHVAELRSRAAEFEKAGARVAVIGNGWPAMAKAFAERNALPASVELFTDPSLKAYQAAGLRRSAILTLGPWAILPFLRTLRHGFRQRRKAGDLWQQGGALVVARGGNVLYRHASWHPGNQASADRLLHAIQ